MIKVPCQHCGDIVERKNKVPACCFPCKKERNIKRTRANKIKHAKAKTS